MNRSANAYLPTTFVYIHQTLYIENKLLSCYTWNTIFYTYMEVHQVDYMV